MPRKEPSNIEAEVNALGCAFLSKDALDKVCEELTSDMFYDSKHRIIHEVISKLRSKDIAVDITTVPSFTATTFLPTNAYIYVCSCVSRI